MKPITVDKFHGMNKIFNDKGPKGKDVHIYVIAKTSRLWWRSGGEKIGIFRISTDGLARSYIDLSGIIKTRKNYIFVGDERELLI